MFVHCKDIPQHFIRPPRFQQYPFVLVSESTAQTIRLLHLPMTAERLFSKAPGCLVVFFFLYSKKKWNVYWYFVDYFVYSDAGIYDRVVVQELIKTVAQSHQLDSTTQKEFKGSINHDLPHHTMFNFSAYYRLYFTESTISSFIVIQSTYYVYLVRYYCKSTNLYNI